MIVQYPKVDAAKEHGATMSLMSRKFSLSMKTSAGFDRSLALLRQSLQHEGLRVVTEIPFHRVFARELGLSWQKYTVLIVWSPFLGYWGALSDRDVGMFIPFHLVVAEDETGTLISATNVALFGQLAGTIGVQALTEDLTQKIYRIFSEIAADGKSVETPSAQGERKGTS